MGVPGLSPRSAFAVAAAFVLAFASACSPSGTATDGAIGPEASGVAAVDDARMLAANAEPQNWLVNGGTLNGEHFSLLNQINLQTVDKLKPAWSFDYDTTRGQEGEPIVVDGVMYISTSWSKVYALDAATGKQLWFYDPKVSGADGAKACCDVVNRGAAVYKGKVYVAALDGRLIALDARDGSVVWSTMTLDPKGMQTITGAPRVVRDKVIIGNAGADFGARGFVSAYDAATGQLAWRFYLVPGDPAKGPDGAASDKIMKTLVEPTWSGDFAAYGGGGTAWQTIMYDAEFNRLYIGTGNGSPWNPKYRTDGKGDNLFLCSIVALDADTGDYVWHYQENPQEAWDYNSTQPMILADLEIGGATRKVLMHAPKNGFFYVIDRTTGKLISAEPTVPVTWATSIDIATGRPIETPNSRYTDGPFLAKPGTAGSHNWHAMAFSPTTGLAYFSVAENSTLFRNNPDFKPITMGPFNHGVISEHKAGSSYLLAWDPVNQREAWRVPYRGGGVLATAGGLIFQGRGTVIGEFVAMRATDGKEVWRWPTPNGIQAAPVSYSVDGVQYVAISIGAGAGAMTGGAEARMRQPGRMIAFKLDGTATLPKEPDVAPPANPAPDTFAADMVDRGKATYGTYCYRCHGPNAVSSNVIPDLRRSPALSDKETWHMIVWDGALESAGMIGWSKYLKPEQVEELRAYVSSQATLLKAGKAPGSVQTGTRRSSEAVVQEQ
ncbi:PQQ-dependent dehydrogenase, methanol/ethanol family [Hephaestia sp. GCM10023244]|uniref:PQQ-dependent dehydrogenase, methanol/ethanol family n=1 Tax=unclassified Hephaestia TaxID=2631281 RepID=UPI002076FBE3|nr:PQQ-dependent dehydrogenase, methanol/ethanol family [Hephaestia sp. MAHUQ-44]MCM8732059.1 PQQ-dependent dehydrogenase, methanol/ethanol family [Hephaestia sp. MAHUQ-44]